MNVDKYLEAMAKEEEKALKRYCIGVIELFNSINKDKLVEIKRTSYKEYSDVLIVRYKSGRIGIINIAFNSVKASARELNNYIYNGSRECQGFIIETYSLEELK